MKTQALMTNTMFKANGSRLLMALALCLTLSPAHAQTQTNASQPSITFVVGYAPGGTTDIIARVIAKELTLQTGQTVIVENKAGANSNIGAEYVANGPTNGTRFYIGSTANAINKSLYKKLNYDIEKDLTAVALLFALYMVKPSPFCLLDELDAPLDESNIGRFTDLLKKFTSSSQFIIITHNKRTVAAADAIYGVTMEQRGVSKTVSMRFNHERGEAEAHTGNTSIDQSVRSTRTTSDGAASLPAPTPA
jgi:hypothetical protein